MKSNNTWKISCFVSFIITVFVCLINDCIVTNPTFSFLSLCMYPIYLLIVNGFYEKESDGKTISKICIVFGTILFLLFETIFLVLFVEKCRTLFYFIAIIVFVIAACIPLFFLSKYTSNNKF